MAFAYAADVGIPSYTEIGEFCRRSNINFSVSSTTGGNHGSSSYHYSGNAADLVSSAGSMQRLAEWLYVNYSPFLLELIHSGGNGYFVKDGKKVGAEFYGASTVAGHYDHVHVAATLSGLAAAGGVNPTGTAETDTGFGSNFKVGCAIPGMSVLLGVTLVVIEGVRVVF